VIDCGSSCDAVLLMADSATESPPPVADKDSFGPPHGQAVSETLQFWILLPGLLLLAVFVGTCKAIGAVRCQFSMKRSRCVSSPLKCTISRTVVLGSIILSESCCAFTWYC